MRQRFFFCKKMRSLASRAAVRHEKARDATLADAAFAAQTCCHADEALCAMLYPHFRVSVLTLPSFY